MCDVIGIYGRWAWMREEKNRFWAIIHRRLFLLLFSSPNRLWLSTPLRPISQPLTRWHRCARNARLIEVSWRRQRFTLIATLSAAEPTKSWVNLRTSSSSHTTLMTFLSPSSKAHPFRFLSPKPVLKQTTTTTKFESRAHRGGLCLLIMNLPRIMSTPSFRLWNESEIYRTARGATLFFFDFSTRKSFIVGKLGRLTTFVAVPHPKLAGIAFLFWLDSTRRVIYGDSCFFIISRGLWAASSWLIEKVASRKSLILNLWCRLIPATLME